MTPFPALMVAIFLLLSAKPAFAELDSLDLSDESTEAAQIVNVNQLADVKSTDWAFQAIQSLIERYGCFVGNSNHVFQGNRTLTRYEFAAGLNTCLEPMNELLATSTKVLLSTEDLKTLKRLQQEFAPELSTIQERIDALLYHNTELSAQQFSTTTKLRGQVIMAANVGGFTGERIVDARNRLIASEQLNPTVLYRVALDLNTSFTGTDSLRILLETGSGGRTTNVAGVLEPAFGSVLDFSVKPPTRETLGIGRLVYSFNPARDLRVSIGPEIRISDYIDRNRYANSSFRDFSSQLFVNNLLLMTNDGPSSGGAISWNPGLGGFSIRAMYSASDAANPVNRGLIRGGASFVPLLYSTPGGRRGLFGDTYQYTTELEYAPTSSFAVRLQYASGEIYSNRFDVFGANFELQLSQQIALFGRYGHANYESTTNDNINPNYWMAGIAFLDLLGKGRLAGIAVGQPFIVSEIGNATQTNFEAFYRIPVSNNIQITPLLQVVTNPSNQSSNGTIYTGTVRTVFSF